MNAFVTGGLVPASQRGSKREGFVAIEDWYKTILGLAGEFINISLLSSTKLPF